MAEETKETKKIIPESKKKHKKKHKKKKVLLKVSVVFLLLVVIGWFTFGAKVMKLRRNSLLSRVRRHLRHHRQVLYMTPTENSY